MKQNNYGIGEREIEFRIFASEKTCIEDSVSGIDNKMHEFDLIDELNEYGSSWCSAFEPIMQYTGLKDKNGKKIFEGDILKHHMQGVQVVYYPFAENCASFGVDGSIEEFRTRSPMQDTHAGYEIIGNIFSNPELIPETK